MPNVLLHIRDDLAGIGLIPTAVELLCHRSKLDNEVAGEVVRVSLAAFLSPEPLQCVLIIPIMIRASEPPIKVRRSIV